MSLSEGSWVLDQNLRPPSHKFLLFILADNVDASGHVCCSLHDLAKDTSMTLEEVSFGLADLVKRGLISDTGIRGRKTQSAVYRFTNSEPDPGVGEVTPEELFAVYKDY